jgi:hypothetical protein
MSNFIEGDNNQRAPDSSEEQLFIYLNAFRAGEVLQENPSDENKEAYEQAVEAIKAWENLHPIDYANHIDSDINS